jgi:hypothetical protein
VWTIRAYEPAFPEGCRDTDPIKAWPGVSAAGRGKACRQRWPSWLHDGLCPCGHAAGCSPPVSSGSGRASSGAVAAAGPGTLPHLVAASAAAGGMPPATATQCLCVPPWAARGRRRIRVQQWWRGGTPARPGAKKTSVKEPPVIRRHRRPRESQLCRCPNGIMSWWSPGVIVRAAGPYETLNLSAPPSRKRSRAEAAHAAPHGIGRPIELSVRCLSARDR